MCVCVFVIDSYMTPLFRSQSYMYVTGRGGLGDKGGAYGLAACDLPRMLPFRGARPIFQDGGRGSATALGSVAD